MGLLVPATGGLVPCALVGALLGVSVLWGLSLMMAAIVGLVVASGAAHLIPVMWSHEATSWLVLLAAVVTMALRVRSRDPMSRLTWVEKWIVFLLLIGFADVLILRFRGIPTFAGFSRMALHAALLFAIAGLGPSKRSLRRVTAGLLAGLGAQIVIALAELWRGETFFFSKVLLAEAPRVWGPFIRIASTAAEPNYLAAGLVAGLPSSSPSPELDSRLGLSYVLAAAWLLTLLMTFSRAASTPMIVFGVMLLSTFLLCVAAGRSPSLSRPWSLPRSLFPPSCARWWVDWPPSAQP